MMRKSMLFIPPKESIRKKCHKKMQASTAQLLFMAFPKYRVMITAYRVIENKQKGAFLELLTVNSSG